MAILDVPYSNDLIHTRIFYKLSLAHILLSVPVALRGYCCVKKGGNGLSIESTIPAPLSVAGCGRLQLGAGVASGS